MQLRQHRWIYISSDKLYNNGDQCYHTHRAQTRHLDSLMDASMLLWADMQFSVVVEIQQNTKCLLSLKLVVKVIGQIL